MNVAQAIETLKTMNPEAALVYFSPEDGCNLEFTTITSSDEDYVSEVGDDADGEVVILGTDLDED